MSYRLVKVPAPDLEDDYVRRGRFGRSLRGYQVNEDCFLVDQRFARKLRRRLRARLRALKIVVHPRRSPLRSMARAGE